MNDELQAVLQALAKEDRTVKDIAEVGYTYLEAQLLNDEYPSLNAAAQHLAEVSVKHGYQRSKSVWANYYKTVNWMVAETEGFNWLEGVAYERHYKAADKMTWEEFTMNPPAARLAGKLGESWLTTMRRAITEAKTGTRHAEVDGKRRNNNARLVREALPSFGEGIEQLEIGMAVLEGT